MSTNIDSIIVVNEQEIITTSIDGYFKNLAIVARFEDDDLNQDITFPQAGYQVFESLASVADVFPTTSKIYKCARDVFTQKVNTGMNKSAVEKVTICQIKSTDGSIEAGLTRIGYTDAYHWVLVNSQTEQADEDADILSFVAYFGDKRKNSTLSNIRRRSINKYTSNTFRR